MRFILISILILCASCAGLNKKETTKIKECLQENRRDFFEIYKNGKKDTDLNWQARDLKLAGAIALCEEAEK